MTLGAYINCFGPNYECSSEVRGERSEPCPWSGVHGLASMILAKTKHFFRSEEMIWRVLVCSWWGEGSGKVWLRLGVGMPAERNGNTDSTFLRLLNCWRNCTHFVFKVITLDLLTLV